MKKEFESLFAYVFNNGLLISVTFEKKITSDRDN